MHFVFTKAFRIQKKFQKKNERSVKLFLRGGEGGVRGNYFLCFILTVFTWLEMNN